MARKTQPARRKPGARERVLAEIRTDIRAAGLRSTAPRIAVLERLRRARAPLSHPELTAQLVPLGFDRATIYRNLVDLADAGLVSRVEVGDHVWRYEVRGREHAPGEAEHSHFVCNDCGTVSCLPEVSIAIRPAPGSRRSVVAEISDVVLKGRCESC
ncbi:MAG: transcriptional repressor [Candidatus Binatia bacterium]